MSLENRQIDTLHFLFDWLLEATQSNDEEQVNLVLEKANQWGYGDALSEMVNHHSFAKELSWT